MDLSLLFGISTEPVHRPRLDGTPGRFDLEDEALATDSELEHLAAVVTEDTLLWLEEHRVGHPFGGGPFAVDDASSVRQSWGLIALRAGITLIEWFDIRAKLWRARTPWTEGLTNLFGCVQEELLSQFAALYPDGAARDLHNAREVPKLESIAVPEPLNTFLKDGDVWIIAFKDKSIKLPANTIGFDTFQFCCGTRGALCLLSSC